MRSRKFVDQLFVFIIQMSVATVWLRRENARRVFEPVAFGWVIRIYGLSRPQRNALKKLVPAFAIDEVKGELLLSTPVAEINVPTDEGLRETLLEELPPFHLLTAYLKLLADLKFRVVAATPVGNKAGTITEFLWTLQI